MMLKCVVLFAIVTLVRGQTDDFKITEGCRQYNSTQGYKYPHPYYAISSFRNAKVTKEGVVKIRLGLFIEKSYAYIRLAPKMLLPNQIILMHEIVFTGRDISVRRYRRKDASTVADVGTLIDVNTLKEIRTKHPIPLSKPLLFTMTIKPSGLVQLAKSSTASPFLQFTDNQNSFNYVSFANRDSEPIFYFDCPLENDGDDDDDDDEDYAVRGEGSGDGGRS